MTCCVCCSGAVSCFSQKPLLAFLASGTATIWELEDTLKFAVFCVDPKSGSIFGAHSQIDWDAMASYNAVSLEKIDKSMLAVHNAIKMIKLVKNEVSVCVCDTAVVCHCNCYCAASLCTTLLRHEQATSTVWILQVHSLPDSVVDGILCQHWSTTCVRFRC